MANLLENLPEKIVLKNDNKTIALYDPSYVTYQEEDYMNANGYYFPVDGSEGINIGDSFQYKTRVLVSVVDIKPTDELICVGYPNHHPETLPTFKVKGKFKHGTTQPSK